VTDRPRRTRAEVDEALAKALAAALLADLREFPPGTEVPAAGDGARTNNGPARTSIRPGETSTGCHL